MNNPDLNLLIALDALLTEASVIKAAQRLNLSPSAMSRTLTRLRASTGDALLVRAGRKMVLTPYAEEIRERTQSTVTQAKAILQPPPLSLDLSLLSRTFTLRTNEGFVEAFGAILIRQVAVLAPLVRLCFTVKQEKSDKYLREGRVDLEIGVLGEMGPEIRVKALFRDKFVALVRKGHPLAQFDNVSITQYLAYGHVVTSRHGLVHGPVDHALDTLGHERNIAAVVSSFTAAQTIALDSDLIALVPSSLVTSQGKYGANHATSFFHTFDLPVKTERITVSQMWHPRLENDPAHRWLRQLIAENCTIKP